MRLLACKINYDLVEQQVPFAHATESPAFVQTKRARLKLFELLRSLGSEFASFDQFF
jgi:hypothetical protein